MRTKIRTARPKTGLQHMHLLHNNFSAHKSLTVAQVLKSEKVNVLSHPTYSPDLALRDLFLSDIEKKISGSRYWSRSALGSAVNQFLLGIRKDKYEN